MTYKDLAPVAHDLGNGWFDAIFALEATG